MPGGGPCSAALRAWLHERPDLSTPGGQGEQAVFLNRHNGRLTTAQARAIFTAIGRATGVPAVFPHRARHTAAAEFLSELPGAEMHLRRRMGHLSNGALAYYVQINDREAKKVAGNASLSTKWGL